MPLRRVVTASIFFLCCFASLFLARGAFALTACKCSCVDTSTTERKLVGPPDAGQTFAQKCTADAVCGAKTLSASYDVVVTVSGSQQHRTACECVTPQISTSLAKQAPSDTACTATCEASCRGQGLAVDATVQPTIIQTPCITDADCKTGVFAKFKGVTCQATPSTGRGPTTYACSVPVSGDVGKQNADIECANYGGAGMNGSTCDFVAAGDSPASYLMTRPYFQASGGTLSYAQRVYDGAVSYPLVANLWAALDADGGISTAPGICYLYGTGEADYSNMNVTAALTQGVNGSKRYICVKHKISQCGTVNIDQTSQFPVVKNAFRYSCTPKSSVPTSQLSSNCLSNSSGITYKSDSGASVKGSDLCAVQNQLCCAMNCTIDAECGPYKACTTDGKCVAKTACNPDNAAWRCRSASAAEKANSGMCLSTLTVPVCQLQGQSCCAPLSATALGSCAADMQTNQSFNSQFPNQGWQQFACLTADQLSKAGQSLIQDWKSGGDCIVGDVVSTEAESRAVSRCGTTKRCCLVNAVAPAQQDALNARPGVNGSCGTGSNFPMKCLDPSTMLAGGSGTTDIERYAVQTAGFDSLDSYLSALGSSSACQATPVTIGAPLNTMECKSGSVCCYSGIRSCDPSANPTGCSAGDACHPQLKICVPASLMNQQLSSQSCADRASAAGDTSVEFIAAKNGAQVKDFSCQIVNSADSLVTTKCAQQGCTAPDGQKLATGQDFRCCVPGTGQSPVATAQGTNSTGGSAAAQSPDTIGLSSCISSGQCTLDDILVTAANFTNFLFRISGAIFLAIFVYAGFLYLTAGGSARGAKGLSMIKQASIGLVLLFAGYVLVNFIQTSFITSATKGAAPDKCGATADTANMTCQYIPVDVNDKDLSNKAKAMGCVQRMCNGPANRVCCPFGKNP